MKRIVWWFQNKSLNFKMMILIFLVVFILQIFNGILFIFTVSEKFEENISQANLVAVEQVAMNLNQSMVSVINSMVPVRSEILSGQLAVNEKTYAGRDIRYRELFSELLGENENYRFVHSMLIFDDSRNEKYVYARDGYPLVNSEISFQNIKKDNTISGQCCWSGMVRESYFFTKGEEELISILMPIYRYGEIEQLLVVNLEVEVIRKCLQTVEDTEGILLLQVERNNYIAGTEEWMLSEEREREFLRAFPQWKPVERIEGYQVMSSGLECNQWKLSMLVPEGTISRDAGVLSQFIITIMFSTGLILLCSVSLIVFMVTKPIKKMIRIMEANRHTRQINHRFPAKYKDEVGILAETYNKLMDEIQQLMVKFEEEQIQSRRAYQRMLQMQIKPHFLYNTLETAKFLAEMGDPQCAEMLTTVGKFYKLSLSGVNDFITIGEELEQLECYLQILKYRYSSRYSYTVEADEEILACETIRFSLQPLVENAVYHGIKPKRGKGFIKVLGYRTEEAVYLVVWDNGAGIPESKCRELWEKLENSGKEPLSEHIGIVNVHQRIRMHYGEEYGLTVESEEGEFTRVEIKIPVKKKLL